MNIAIVHDSFKQSATFKHIFFFANEMCRLGHNVLLITYRDEGFDSLIDSKELLFKNIQCKLNGNKLDSDFIDTIIDFKPDIVHSFCNKYELYVAYLIKKATNSKLILHYEDNFEKIFFNKMSLSKLIKILLSGVFFYNVWPWYNLLLEKRLLKHVDGFDVLTEQLKKDIESKNYNKPLEIVHPPVDLSFFRPTLDSSELKAKLNLTDNFVIMHSGTTYCHWLDGFDKFFHAISLVKKSIPTLKLVFTGRKVGDSTKFFDLINKHKLKDIFIDLEYIDNFNEMPKYLALADILFEPQSLYIFDEYRLPSKVHNYMASGKPIITFSNGFMKELSDKEMVKIDFQRDSTEKISKIIIDLYNDPDLRSSLGHNAREKAEQLFDKKENTLKLLAFYEKVLKS